MKKRILRTLLSLVLLVGMMSTMMLTANAIVDRTYTTDRHTSDIDDRGVIGPGVTITSRYETMELIIDGSKQTLTGTVGGHMPDWNTGSSYYYIDAIYPTADSENSITLELSEVVVITMEIKSPTKTGSGSGIGSLGCSDYQPGHCRMTDNDYVKKGTNITLEASPSTTNGYSFFSWTYEDGSLASTNAEYTFAATKSQKYIANVHKCTATYTAVQNKIIANWNVVDGCTLHGSQETLTLVAPTSLIYDGNRKTVAVSNSSIGTFPNVPAVTYEGDWTSVGSHKATLTCKGATATLNFTIQKIPVNTVDVSAITPEPGKAPQTTISGTGYTGTIAWENNVAAFGYNTDYTATINLAAAPTYTFRDFALDGWTVSASDGDALTLKRTFKTRKEKLTGVTKPENKTLAVYHANAAGAITELPETVTYSTETGGIKSAAIAWSCADYNAVPGATNSFTWTVAGGELASYESGSVFTTGSITVTNAAALAVTNSGSDKTTTYNGSTFNLAALFSLDTNAGAAVYTIDTSASTGEGTITGSQLTITKVGTFSIQVDTAAQGAYAAGNATAKLTVNKGTPTCTIPTGLNAVYGSTLADVTLPAGWTWNASGMLVGDVGTRIHRATFTPEDTVNYNTVAQDLTVVVSRKNITGAAIGDFAQMTYNGAEQTPSAEVTIDGLTVTGTWSKVTNVGETATFTANGNFEGTVTANPGMAPKNITNAQITLKDQDFIYNGQTHTQNVTSVTLDSLSVTYTVTGNTQTNAGTHTLTVTGNGNFTGSKTASWSIAPKNITGATITLGADLTYNGAEQTKTVNKVEIGGLNVETYTVTGNNATKAGSYILTVAGNGNFTGSATASWSIAKANYDMSGAKWDYTEPFAYDGLEKTVRVTGLPANVTALYNNSNKATAAGEYTAKAAFSYDTTNYNAPTIADLTWKIENNWNVAPTEFSVSTMNDYGWRNDKFEVIPGADYWISYSGTDAGPWETKLTENTETGTGKVIFYLRDKNTRAISLPMEQTYKLDKTPPTGKVEFAYRSGLQSALNSITLGLFYKDEVSFTVQSADALSGVAKVEYCASDKAKTPEEIKAITNWTAYPSGGVSVTLEDAKQFVYFARISDKAGNVTYLSTDGAEYDTTAPAITGIENGKTYYTTQTVTVTEKNLYTLTLNGTAVTSPVTLKGNTTATYTIVAKDKAGNETTVTVKMLPIASLGKEVSGLNVNNVTSDDKTDAETVLANVNKVLQEKNIPAAQKAELENLRTKAQNLLRVIDESAKALETADIRKVEAKDESNVKLSDKTDLETAKAALEDALTPANKRNYTAQEQAAIQKEIDRLEKAIAAIEETQTVMDTIAQLPQSIKPDLGEKDEKAIRDAMVAYEALTDHQKTLVQKENTAKLEQLFSALTDYKIAEGNGSNWTQDSETPLTFTANGPARKFKELRVDGQIVASADYICQDSRITLEESYLQTLASGKHTIQIVYADGETGEASFTINQNSSKMLGAGIGGLSLLSLILILIIFFRKKKKQEEA